MPDDAMLKNIFEYIDNNNEPYVERLMDYVRRPSISVQRIGIDEVAEYIADIMEKAGLETKIHPTNGCPIVLGRRQESESAPTILFYGHYDVQPPDPLEAWISPPFEPEIRDGRIFGRGVGDNKGQHFAQILAIESFLACQPKLPCNVIVLLEGEEETGSSQLAGFIQDNCLALKADLAVIADGPIHESGRPCILFGVRGVIGFELKASGANRDLHSGNWGGIAPNPLWQLVHLLASMKNESGEITIDGFYENVKSPTELELSHLSNLPDDADAIKKELGIKNLDPSTAKIFGERTAFLPTLTINGLHGGYDGPGSKTVLPCSAMAKCDIRLVANQTVEEISEKVTAHIKKHAPDVEILFHDGMEPSKTSIDSPFTEPISKAIFTAQKEKPLLIPSLGGSLPAYVFTDILGIPTFGVPYANHDENNHAPNENLDISRFVSGIKTGAAVMVHIGSIAKLPRSGFVHLRDRSVLNPI